MKAFKKSKIMIGLLMLVVLAITAACTPAAAPPQAGQMGESAMSETTDYMPWSPVWRVRPALSADGPMAESPSSALGHLLRPTLSLSLRDIGRLCGVWHAQYGL